MDIMYNISNSIMVAKETIMNIHMKIIIVTIKVHMSVIMIIMEILMSVTTTIITIQEQFIRVMIMVAAMLIHNMQANKCVMMLLMQVVMWTLEGFTIVTMVVNIQLITIVIMVIRTLTIKEHIPFII